MTPFEPAVGLPLAELEVPVDVPLLADFDTFYAAQFERAVGLAYAPVRKCRASLTSGSWSTADGE